MIAAEKYAREIIKSKSEKDLSFSSIQELAKELANGWVILWQHHKIFLGKIGDKSHVDWLGSEEIVGTDNEPDQAHILQLRAFNEEREYHFWRNGISLQGRLRNDKDGSDTTVIGTPMVLRSMIAIPWADATNTNTSNKQEIIICTRNYIEYNPETQQAGYVDSRFVKIDTLKPNT